jgi:hypothetical protein
MAESILSMHSRGKCVMPGGTFCPSVVSLSPGGRIDVSDSEPASELAAHEWELNLTLLGTQFPLETINICLSLKVTSNRKQKELSMEQVDPSYCSPDDGAGSGQDTPVGHISYQLPPKQEEM